MVQRSWIGKRTVMHIWNTWTLCLVFECTRVRCLYFCMWIQSPHGRSDVILTPNLLENGKCVDISGMPTDEEIAAKRYKSPLELGRIQQQKTMHPFMENEQKDFSVCQVHFS